MKQGSEKPKSSDATPGSEVKTKSARFRWLHAIIYLLVVTIICYWPTLGPGRTFLPADLVLLIPPWSHHAAEIAPNWHAVSRPVWDPLFVFYPARKFLADAIHAGFVPWHDPYHYGGSPYIADGQSAFFYPINWLFAILPLASAFGIVSAVHTFLAGLFFTLFMRQRRCGWEASLVGATTWMLCGVMVAWQMWQVVDSTLCWLPLSLYFADRLNTSAQNTKPYWLAFVGVAASFGMMLVAGHMQFAFYGIVIVCCYILACGSQKFVNRLVSAIGVSMLAGATAMVQILPTIDLLHLSLRGQNNLGELVGTSLPLSHLALLFMPEILGGERDWMVHGYLGSVNYYEVTTYIGVAAAVFAVFAFYKPSIDQKCHLWFWSAVGIVGILVGCGTPVYDLLFYTVPIFKSFHGVARTLVLTDLAIAVLAAYGVQKAVDADTDPARQTFFGRAAGGVGLLAIALYGIVASRTPAPIVQILTHDWLGYGLTQLSRALIIVAVAWIASVPLSRNLRFLVVAVVAADMLTFAAGLSPGADSNVLYPTLPAVQAMQQTAGTGRVVCLGGRRDLDRMIPNSAESIGLSDVSGSDPLSLANYELFINQLNTVQTGSPAPSGAGMVAVGGNPALDYMNTTSIISPQPLTIPSYQMTYSGPDIYIYANPNAKGEAWIEAAGGPVGSEYSDLLNGKVLVVSGPGDSLSNIVKQPERISVDTNLAGPDSVVFSEVADPSWKATVDGSSTPWSVAHGLLIKVPVASGTHTVQLRYLPDAGVVGLYLTGVGWMIVAWIVTANSANKLPKKSS